MPRGAYIRRSAVPAIPGPPGPQGPAGSSAIVTWGADQIAASTTDRFLWPWYTDMLAPTFAVQWIVPRPGTFRNMFVLHNMPAGNGNNIVYTLRVNSIATLLAVTLASTGVSNSNLVNTVAVVQGDLVDLIATKALSIANSPNDIVVSMELA